MWELFYQKVLFYSHLLDPALVCAIKSRRLPPDQGWDYRRGRAEDYRLQSWMIAGLETGKITVWANSEISVDEQTAFKLSRASRSSTHWCPKGLHSSHPSIHPLSYLAHNTAPPSHFDQKQLLVVSCLRQIKICSLRCVWRMSDTFDIDHSQRFLLVHNFH